MQISFHFNLEISNSGTRQNTDSTCFLDFMSSKFNNPAIQKPRMADHTDKGGIISREGTKKENGPE
jgi:hypothetical protein